MAHLGKTRVPPRENNSEKHAIKTDKITIQGFTSDWGIPQFNDEAEQPLLRNTNSNEKLA